MVVGGQGGGVKMFGLRGVSVGVVAVFCGGRKCKKRPIGGLLPAYRYFLILFSRYATASPKGKPLILFAFGVRLAAGSFAGRARKPVSG